MSTSQLPHVDCPVCAQLDAFIEIENAQSPSDTDIAQAFPDEVEQLRAPNPDLERYYRYGNERLLKCEACGTYYWYRTRAPGGSEDVLHTYIHESVRRLSFLEAYVELEDALYQAAERVRENGSVYEEEHQAAGRGVEAEMPFLRARHREIAVDAVVWLEHKYRRSEELEETLRLYAPHLDRAQRLAEARARDEAAARYYAGVLADQMRQWGESEVPARLLRRMVGLLADEDAAVRGTVLSALLCLLAGPGGRGTVAEAVAGAVAELAPWTAEAEGLLRACGRDGHGG